MQAAADSSAREMKQRDMKVKKSVAALVIAILAASSSADAKEAMQSGAVVLAGLDKLAIGFSEKSRRDFSPDADGDRPLAAVGQQPGQCLCLRRVASCLPLAIASRRCRGDALGGLAVDNLGMDKALTEEDRTTAIGLARYAYEYIAAAMLVEHNDPTPTHSSPIPAYFLALHGIELTLKSFLRHKGVTAKELRGQKYGHDLHACHKKAKELGLLSIFKEQANDTDAMRMLVGLNEHQGLRYIKTGMKQFPLWSLVEPLAVRLHQAVAAEVGYKSFTVTYH
jgi:hypothetical protein